MARRRLRVANVSLYVGVVAAVGGSGAYVAAAPEPSRWFAAAIVLVPIAAGGGLARRLVRRL